jgi:hypothetical protein
MTMVHPHIETSADYEQYNADVAAFLKREEIDDFSCEPDCEPHFSRSPCDCCGRHLGGNRRPVTARRAPTKAFLEYEVCDDCVYFVAYGRLDDTTMLESERSG